MRVAGWRSVLGGLRPMDLACLATCFTAASVAAEQPLNVLDPSLRDVSVQVEISSNLNAVGESFGSPLPATYSASGTVGTLVIPVTSHEAMRAGVLTPIPGTFTPIVIEIDLTTLTATSQTTSGALESGPILMAFVQNPLGTEAAAGYMTGGDITAPIFCASQAEVDALCMIEPIFCGVICVVVPGSPYDAATGEINLVGSEEQQGCDGAVCGGPFVLFTQRGDLRLTEPPLQRVPALAPGAGLLLAVLLAVSAGTALRPPSTFAPRRRGMMGEGAKSVTCKGIALRRGPVDTVAFGG